MCDVIGCRNKDIKAIFWSRRICSKCWAKYRARRLDLTKNLKARYKNGKKEDKKP